MSGLTTEIVSHRLDRLERENRWWKRIGVVALAALVAVVLMGQATLRKVPRVVEAEKFVLRDAGGSVRATFSLWENRTAALSFFNYATKKTVSAILGTRENGVPFLYFYDKAGKNRLDLSVSPNGSPSLSLLDKEAEIRAALGSTSVEMTRTGAVVKRPESSLVLFDKDGKVIWQAP
ncbi:MAG: hypothetical protein ACE5JQ_16235 [Candidatus Methylomirabilales bacterium]